MKNLFSLAFISFLFVVFRASSQKQGDIWYFAEYAGLDFSNGDPALLTDGQVASVGTNSEGCSTISDSAGNLLFYATPTTIWNRNHQVMPNGSDLMGGLSSSQGVLIIPKPKSSNLFYVFTED